VDELNSLLGVINSYDLEAEIKSSITRVQGELMMVGSDLATPLDLNEKLKQIRIKQQNVESLENEIDGWTVKLPELKSFILPTGSITGSLIHFARTICRRAERNCVKLGENEAINETVVIYLNRLSDWLFTLARYQNCLTDKVEKEWHFD